MFDYTRSRIESCEWNDIGCWFQKYVDFLVDCLQWIWEGALSILVFVINSITSTFGILLPDLTHHLPPEIYYFVSAFQPEQGVSIIMTAYFGRFILRRIPLIG